MHGRVELATAGVRHLLDELWSRAVDGEAPDTIGRARLRLAAAEAVATGADVVRTAACSSAPTRPTGRTRWSASPATARCSPTTGRSTPRCKSASAPFCSVPTTVLPDRS